MKTTYHILQYLLIFLLTMGSLQQLNAQSAKAKKLLKEANQYYETYDYTSAIPLYRDILLNNNIFEAKLKLAECYRMTKNYTKAEYWYRQIQGEFPKDPIYKLRFGKILQSNGKCNEAVGWFKQYGQYNDLGNILATGCENEEQYLATSNDYELWLLPINSESSDFGAVMYENGIFFCSDRAEIMDNKGNRNNKSGSFVDVYFAEKQPGNAYTIPQKAKGDINSTYNDGPLSITEDGYHMFLSRNSVFSSKKQKNNNGAIHLSIITGTRTGNKRWGNISRFTYQSDTKDRKRTFSVAHPAVAPDGKTIYFIADMPGGFGGTDLYMCTKVDTVWSEPINLGANVNTQGNELFPYYHANGILYFASDGHPGLGGLDVYQTQLESQQWTKPQNMGAPINSTMDDFSFTLLKEGNSGYFSSNRNGGFGSDDIYYFVKNNVSYNVTNVNLNSSGKASPSVNTIINNTIGLQPIGFKKGDWSLSKNAKVELDKVMRYLHNNPGTKIEIGAHTDSRGNDFANFELSEKRASSCRSYMVQNGISPSRVLARAYGEIQLLNHCREGMECNEEQHKQNNRIEVKILSVNNTANTSNFVESKENTVEENIATTREQLKTFETKQEATRNNNENKDENYNLSYKVYVGPYASVDNNTFYKIKEINTSIDLEYTVKGMMIVLGPYDNLSKAEEIKIQAQEKGAKKTNIVIFRGNEKTNMSVKKLKKMGIE